MNDLSFSSIDQFQSCPRSWFVQNVLGEEQPPSQLASRGLQFDRMIAHSMGLGQPPSKPVGEEVGEAVKVYMNHPNKFAGACEAQKKIEINPNQWDVLSEEYGIPFRVDIPIIGYIDLYREIDGGLRREICDLKTSQRNEWRPKWGLQCTLYALSTQSFQWHVHLLTFTKVPKVVVWSYRPTRSTFAWAMQVIGASYERMKRVEKLKSSDEVEALPGYHCAWCPRQTSCEGAIINGLVGQV